MFECFSIVVQTAVILLDIAYKPELSLAVSPAPARQGDTLNLNCTAVANPTQVSITIDNGSAIPERR